MTLDGIDVSVWQSTTPDLTGQSFLFARATYGTAIDGKYAMHIANARAAGLTVGAYHFGRSTSAAPIATQAAVFLGAAGDVDLYVLDLESDGSAVGMTNAEAAQFIAAVQATGRKCGLYHSASGFPQLGQDWNWVAQWTANPPTIPWTFWQWQGDPLDRDRFAGDAAALAALIGKTQEAEMPGFGFKIAGAPVAVQIRPNEDHKLINLARTDPPFYGPFNWGPSPNSLPIDLIDPADDQPIDIDGHKPPQNGRNECYLYDDGQTFGRAAAALRADCDVISAPAPTTDCSAVQAQLDAANAKLAAVRQAIG